jgi:hypothetical protein
MENSEAGNLYDFVYEIGNIVSVIGCNELEPVKAFEFKHFDEVQFVCKHGIFTVVAEGEFDTVGLKMTESELPFKRVISRTEPWIRVIEKSIKWAWLLTNQQGYTDGFQFEVRTDGGYVNVQLMCAASSFSVHVVTPS